MRRKKQLRLGLLRSGALTLVLTGLFLFNLHWARREPTLVRIGEIAPIMNFSKVRVEGVLKSDARTLRGGAVLYLIADETGSLPVFLNRSPSEKLHQAGSRISATGRLSIGTGNQVRLRVHDVRQIKMLEGATPTVVRGRVREVRPPPPDSNAPHKIILTTASGELEVVHWFNPAQKVAVGDQLEVKGAVGYYKGRLQLKVTTAGDIRLQAGG